MEINELFEWMKAHKPQPVHIKFAPEIIRFSGMDVPNPEALRNEGFYFGFTTPKDNPELRPLSMDMIEKVAAELRASMPPMVKSVCVWTEEDRIFYAMKGYKVFDLREAENGTITVTEWKQPLPSFIAGEPFPAFPPETPANIQ